MIVPMAAMMKKVTWGRGDAELRVYIGNLEWFSGLRIPHGGGPLRERTGMAPWQ